VDHEHDYEHILDRTSPAASEKEIKTFRLAGFWIRALSYAVDLVIVSALTYLITTPLFDGDVAWPVLKVTFFYVGIIGSFYFILMTKYFGQTVGKMLFGLQVVRKDGEPLDWLTVLFREGVGRFLAQYVFCIGFLWAAFHPRKNGWHDLIADTYVIYDQAEEKRLQVTLNSEG
jgi:uncharacterized RDD family membrane protein YckC